MLNINIHLRLLFLAEYGPYSRDEWPKSHREDEFTAMDTKFPQRTQKYSVREIYQLVTKLLRFRLVALQYAALDTRRRFCSFISRLGLVEELPSDTANTGKGSRAKKWGFGRKWVREPPQFHQTPHETSSKWGRNICIFLWRKVRKERFKNALKVKLEVKLQK